MIIDTHVHFGKMGQFDMDPQILLQAMAHYKVDFALISNVEACEIDPETGTLLTEISQIEANRRTVELVRRYPAFFKGLFWVKPRTEGFTSAVGQFMLENKGELVGFKVHPFYSQLPITDSAYTGYLEFANEHSLPIAVHTALDETSAPLYVYQVAKKYPQIAFIMVHMELGSDHKTAINLAAKLSNLYLDTTWVKADIVKKAVEKCGSHKVLFGSDAPIDGEYTYEFYQDYLDRGAELFSPAVWQQVAELNAKNIFHL